MTDEEIIKEIRNGNIAIFRDLIFRYESRVAATVIGMLGKTPEAEDVGQDVFVRFFNSLKNFRGESSVGTYLVRIAINLSLNEIKRRRDLLIVSMELLNLTPLKKQHRTR